MTDETAAITAGNACGWCWISQCEKCVHPKPGTMLCECARQNHPQRKQPAPAAKPHDPHYEPAGDDPYGWKPRALKAEREVAELRATLDTFDKRCADALADEVAVLVRRKVIGSRSPAADALLDYRDPPTTPRADRLAALEAELGEAVGLLGNFLADPDVRVDMDPGVLDHANDLVKRYRAALAGLPGAPVDSDQGGTPK